MSDSTALPSVKEIAKTIDHALLRPNMTRDDVLAGLKLAAEYDVFSVCVRPSDIRFAKENLAGSDVKVGTVIGFPHGVNHTNIKVAEIFQAADDGADEIDAVINIAWVKSGMAKEIVSELAALVQACVIREIPVLKIILETAYLTDEEIALASRLVHESGAEFVKTSTGFAGEGATIKNLQIMKDNITAPTELKASGGITTLDILLEMRDLGVTRFGSSASKVILDDLAQRLSDGTQSEVKYDGSY